MLRSGAVALLVLELGCSGGSAASTHGASHPDDLQKVAYPMSGEVRYRGHTIAFDEGTRPPLLTVDGYPIAAHGGGNTRGRKRYSTPVLSYSDYSSLLELGKALIDTSVLDLAAGKPHGGSAESEPF